ncbi:MAG: AmpG family muropeptide MFS transporter [Hyphomicrobiales bacterium]
MSSPSQTGSPDPRRSGLAQALSVYFERRVLIVLLLGFSAGLPLALAGSTLTIWMADKGVSLGAIGLFSLVGVPYTVKFLWAPVVDAWRVPVLCRLLGRRRGWLIFTQALLMAAILFLGACDPVNAPALVAAGALLVTIASATQDIVIDAFRVESLDDDQQAAGMACYVAAYRGALLVATAGVIALIAVLERAGVPADVVWAYGYGAMAALVLIGMAAVLVAREPEAAAGSAAEHVPSMTRLTRTAVDAFADFLAKPQAIAVLVFVVLFKFCDAFAGVMTGPFVIDIGFDKAAYAGIVKGVGFAAVLAGGFAGGLVARSLPLVTALWIAGIVQMLSNLMFSWQAHMGVDHAALTATIAVENFTGGLGTVIFVAYLSSLCTNALHTATQFALLTALAAVGRTVLSSISGFVAETSGWLVFFALSALSAVPALALLAYLQHKGLFADEERRDMSPAV